MQINSCWSQKAALSFLTPYCIFIPSVHSDLPQALFLISPIFGVHLTVLPFAAALWRAELVMVYFGIDILPGAEPSSCQQLLRTCRVTFAARAKC